MKKKRSIKQEILNFVMITVGAVIAAFAIADFLAPNQIFDGGIVGVSMIAADFSGFKLAILTWVLNVPFLVFALKMKGHFFVIRSVYAMTAFAVAIGFFETTPAVTDDHLLAVTFGALILGVGVGLVLRYGGCLDGTEIVASVLTKKLHLPIARQVLMFNIVLYLVVGVLYTWNRGLYSILTYVLASIIITRVEEGFDALRGCMIFTHDDVQEIKDRIYNELGRTCTEWNTSGYIGGENNALYVVISRFELRQLRDIVDDYNCFVAVNEIDEIIGRHIKATV